jgi:putative membrane protein insertion efficiency factor
MSENRLTRTLGTFFVVLIRAYQVCLSPFLGPCCRFYPSCSQYAVDAIRRYGPVKGSGLALRRLLRCHPWHPGGYDPVQ